MKWASLGKHLYEGHDVDYWSEEEEEVSSGSPDRANYAAWCSTEHSCKSHNPKRIAGVLGSVCTLIRIETDLRVRVSSIGWEKFEEFEYGEVPVLEYRRTLLRGHQYLQMT